MAAWTNHPETNARAEGRQDMTTFCRAYATESDARAAVERLLGAGLPGRSSAC
jgi:hypothetical protein